VAALFHALNHAAFKGLLFLSAGAVVHGTGTRDMEQLGGLIGRMGWAAALFLVGACAISALPPLNGFASEWLLFHALLSGAALPRPEIAMMMPIAVAALALCGGLAAACFVKAFGISFLGLPRSASAGEAHEAPRTMRIAMGISAVLCIVFGLVPGAVSRLIRTALADSLAAASFASPGGASITTVTSAIAFGQVAPFSLASIVGLVAAGAAIAGLLGRFGGRIRIEDTWGCGRVFQTARMQYTATAFAEPLRRVFRGLYQPTEDVTIESHPESPYFTRAIAYQSDVHPWIERVFYGPTVNLFNRIAMRARGLQSGSLHLYIAYLFGALLFLLVMSPWL
jgi:hydrogenase-4 component B